MPVSMLVLFSIAMVCFFALFGMLVILLRQAKAEGTLEQQQQAQRRKIRHTSQSERASDTHAPFGVSQAGVGDLSLSNLVPAKQPDWRFMVREGVRASKRQSDRLDETGRKGPKPFHYGVNRPDREYFNKDLGDLTDPQSSNMARRA